MSYPSLVGGEWLAAANAIANVNSVESDRRRRRVFGSGIARGLDSGANPAFGGERLQHKHDGYHLSPALLTEFTNDMTINREEILGQVASVIRVRDYTVKTTCTLAN